MLGKCNSLVLVLHLSSFGDLLEDTSAFYISLIYPPSVETRAHGAEGQGQKGD